ncbi:uncharacterized protein LOC125501483 [Athalia rosae]|uniref:uncharacterized protein LOC125501483 n=1 Tax=Athalia rosae TaxID=37344 RepID=UPI0020341716|nr:uncharacterized protein LOC125501483 [Athalia rosae]
MCKDYSLWCFLPPKMCKDYSLWCFSPPKMCTDYFPKKSIAIVQFSIRSLQRRVRRFFFYEATAGAAEATSSSGARSMVARTFFEKRQKQLARGERHILGFILDSSRSSPRYSSTFNYYPYVVLKNSCKAFNQSSLCLVHRSTYSTSNHEGQALHGIAQFVYRYSEMLSPQL